MSFKRLVSAVDEWAVTRGRRDVVAQIGPTDWRPQHLEWVHFLDPQEYREHCQAANFIVAHAGIGSIITALEYGTPVLVMPRRADLGETRNDHQLATANYFGMRGWVSVAMNQYELVAKLDDSNNLGAPPRIGPYASAELLTTIRMFVNGEPRVVARETGTSALTEAPHCARDRATL